LSVFYSIYSTGKGKEKTVIVLKRMYETGGKGEKRRNPTLFRKWATAAFPNIKGSILYKRKRGEASARPCFSGKKGKGMSFWERGRA